MAWRGSDFTLRDHTRGRELVAGPTAQQRTWLKLGEQTRMRQAIERLGGRA